MVMDMATNYIGQSLGKETRDSYMMLAQTLLLVDGGYKYLNGKKKKNYNYSSSFDKPNSTTLIRQRAKLQEVPVQSRHRGMNQEVSSSHVSTRE